MEFIRTHFWESVVAIPLTIYFAWCLFGNHSGTNQESSGGGIVSKVKSMAGSVTGSKSSAAPPSENKTDSK